MIDLDQRQWTHEESPEGTPSAAAYREGCRCDGCRAANSAYMKAWRESRVPQIERPDGTAEYHSHRGKPSARTARRWGCAQTSCLAMGGLYLDGDGVVREIATGAVAEPFGTVAT